MREWKVGFGTGLAAVGVLLGVLGATHLGLYRVKGRSMAPTLADGELVLICSASGTLRGWCRTSVAHGEIVVLRLSPADPLRIKRVVGLPGDTLSMRSGRLYRNGVPAPEPYLPPNLDLSRTSPPGAWHHSYLARRAHRRGYHPRGQEWGPLVVPNDAFFVLGDNRVHSGDSRRFGFIRREEIEGRTLLIR